MSTEPGHDGSAHDRHGSGGDRGGHGPGADASSRRLAVALAVNLVFLVIEVVGGLMAGSLALLADAGHMLTDVSALALALFVARLARRPSTPERTYGLLRAEVLGAFVNGAALVLVVGYITLEAVRRFQDPGQIDAPLMIGVAVAGLLANLASAAVLARGREQDLNLQGAFLHMVGDVLGSVGAVIAGLAIWASPRLAIVDPIASVAIGGIIVYGAVGLLKQTVNILLEATPEHISYLEVKKSLEDMEGVAEVHDLHIWNITSGVPALTAHLCLAEAGVDLQRQQEVLDQAQAILKQKHDIEHVTLQLESHGAHCGKACEWRNQND